MVNPEGINIYTLLNIRSSSDFFYTELLKCCWDVVGSPRAACLFSLWHAVLFHRVVQAVRQVIHHIWFRSIKCWPTWDSQEQPLSDRPVSNLQGTDTFYSRLIVVTQLTGFWPRHLLNTTEPHTHSSTLGLKLEQCVFGAHCRNNVWLGDSMLLNHCRFPVCLKSPGDVFWETLDENSLSHCHVIFFRSPFLLFIFSLYLFFFAHAHPLMQFQLKTTITASLNSACYDWGQIEYAC